MARFPHNRHPADPRPNGPADVEAGRTGDHWVAPRDYGAQAAAGGQSGAHERWQGGPPSHRREAQDPFMPQPYRYDMKMPPGVLHDGEQLLGGQPEGMILRNERGGPKGYRRSDDRIREDICDELVASAHIDSSDVTVEVEGGTVTLEGIVPERRMKHAIEDIAAGCRGVIEVENRIRVVRGGAEPLLDR